MFIIKHTRDTEATPAQVWQVWQDVKQWNTWDHDLASSELNGPFMTGTTGSLTFKDGTQLSTILTDVQPSSLFIQEAKLFLAKAVMSHSIDVVHDKTQVTIQTEIRGPLALLYVWFIGSSIKKKVPLEMEEMLKKATNIVI